MKTGFRIAALSAMAAALLAVSATGQVTTNSLPAGFTAADFAALTFSPEQVVLGLDNFNNTIFTAGVSYAVATAAGAPGDYFYWYRVNAKNFVLPADSIGRITVNLNTALIKTVGPVLQFGQYENNGVGPLSLVAQGVTPLKISWDATPNGDGLFAGETSYLWVVSTWPPAARVSMQIIDGGVATAHVPAPIPEPLSMTMAGLGLAAIAALRRKA
ncbi:MAG: PEP-CTERM sorting domain-containing protein [Armatimonadota bacterium]